VEGHRTPKGADNSETRPDLRYPWNGFDADVYLNTLATLHGELSCIWSADELLVDGVVRALVLLLQLSPAF
jgi:hypothetical protein